MRGKIEEKWKKDKKSGEERPGKKVSLLEKREDRLLEREKKLPK